MTEQNITVKMRQQEIKQIAFLKYCHEKYSEIICIFFVFDISSDISELR